MKFKKSIFGASTLAAVVTPIATVVACGSSSEEEKIFHFEYEANKTGVYLALDGSDHSADDKSFNQQGKEAIHDFQGRELKASEIVKPASGDGDAPFKQMYATIPSDSIIVAPGFSHVAPLNAATEEIVGKAVILLDGTVKKPNVISIQFRVEQAAFLSGHALAKALLADVVKTQPTLLPLLDKNGDGIITVSTFGGLEIPSVTGFMNGFKKGFEKAIAESADTTAKSKVNFFKFGTTKEHFSGSFAKSGGTQVVKNMKAQKVDLILPVAGPQTQDVLDADLNAIGVDTPQETIFKKVATGQSGVLFSILKNLKDSTIDALNFIANFIVNPHTPSITQGFGVTTIGDLSNGWVGMSSYDVNKDIYDIYLQDSKLDSPVYAEALAQTEALAQNANFTL